MNPWTEWTTATTGTTVDVLCYVHQETPAETCRARSNTHADIAMIFGPSSDDHSNTALHAELADVYALLADVLEASEALARSLP